MNRLDRIGCLSLQRGIEELIVCLGDSGDCLGVVRKQAIQSQMAKEITKPLTGPNQG